MIFTKRHSPNNVFVEAFQLPIPFNKGVDWLVEAISANNFIIKIEDSCIVSLSKGSITIQSGDWIVKKENNQIWLLSDQRMNDFFVYAPGQKTSSYVDMSNMFNHVEKQSVQEQVVEETAEVVEEQLVQEQIVAETAETEETAEVVEEQSIQEQLVAETAEELQTVESIETAEEQLVKPKYSRSRRITK